MPGSVLDTSSFISRLTSGLSANLAATLHEVLRIE